MVNMAIRNEMGVQEEEKEQVEVAEDDEENFMEMKSIDLNDMLDKSDHNISMARKQKSQDSFGSDDHSREVIKASPRQPNTFTEALQGAGPTCNCKPTVLVVEDNYYNVVPLKMILK
jgi:CheY-like chemotaxis protein